jgi:gingipain R
MTVSQRPQLARVLFLALGFLLLGGLASAQGRVEVTVLDPTPGATLLKVSLEGYATTPAPTAGAGYLELAIPGEGYADVPGEPRLPRVSRSLVIPPDRAVQARVVSARWHDVPGVRVAPGRGPIPRSVDPDDVPYTFGPAYGRDAFQPAELVGTRAPYIMRDVRGAVLDLNVLQYNPSRNVLRVYDELLVRVESTGAAQVNPLELAGQPDRSDANFARLFRHHFVNWVPTKAISFSESGDMLIISHGPFMAAMQPFVDWKSSQGIQTTIVDVATIGNSYSAIKSYIQGVYAGGNLSYVLLVGDLAEVATGSYAGGESDPAYSTLTADWYPDILVGRFSASAVAHVQTQVERSIEYEQTNHVISAGGWHTYGMGIASNQGPGHYGEYDNQHMDNVRQDLLGYGFTKVDQVYDPYGTRTQIKNGLEEGRRLIHYCGHGSDTSWGTTGWSNGDINALVNDNLLPAIHSVACVNGNFSTSICFGEAWLRATHNGEPTGAVGAYMSSINQYWNEPMYAQDETVDLFSSEAFWGMGALWFAGSCKMMDLTSNSGRDMFMTWHCFGDPSLRLLGYPDCGQPTSFCTAGINSTNAVAAIGMSGSSSVSAADMALTVTGGVPGNKGLFFYASDTGSLPFGNGTLCVNGNGNGTYRLVPAVTIASDGTASDVVDYAALPAGGQITPGSTWYFQFWYRDPAGGGAGFNLSDGLEVTFCP